MKMKISRTTSWNRLSRVMFEWGSLVVLWIVVGMVSACGTVEPADDTLADSGNRIDFERLKVGQESRYVSIDGSGYSSNMSSAPFEYNRDTLVLHVVQVTDSG